jgi:outer membrane protein assembly factor BamB
LLALAAAPALAGARDWPQWRGPDRTDVSQETGLLKEWPKSGPPLLWTYADAGIGFSAPAVVGDRLYAMGARKDAGGKEVEFLYALDVNTSRQVWAARIGPIFTFKSNTYGDGPRGTPTVVGERIYALGGQGELLCAATADGREIWRKSLPRDLHGEMMTSWGYSESPLVDGDRLICSPGGPEGTLAALDKKTGKVLWRSKELKDKATYASAVVATVGGVRQYVQTAFGGQGQGGGGVAGVAAKDGRLLWYYHQPKYNILGIVPTPVVRDNLVYVTAGEGAGCDLLQISPDGGGKFTVKQLYPMRNRRNMKNDYGGVLLLGGHVYGFCDKRTGWVCQDFKTGKISWDNKRKLGPGSLTCADGRLYLYGEDEGTAVLIDASPKGWKEHGRFTIPKKSRLPETRPTSSGAKIWTHPVVANGRLYLRDQEYLFCFDVRKK